MRPKTFIGEDKKRQKYFGRFYRDGNQCLKKDLIAFDELEFKDTKRGKIRRSASEKNQILHSLYAEKEKEIQKRAAEVALAVERNFIQLSKEYLAQVKTLRDSKTHKSYSRALKAFNALFGRLETHQLELKHLSILISDLQTRQLAKPSINSMLIEIGVFLNWCRAQDLPLRSFKIPKLRYTRKEPVIFSASDLDRIENYLELKISQNAQNRVSLPRYTNLQRAHFMLRYTGMRASELLHLRWMQIDPDFRFVIIKDSAKQEIKGRQERKIPIAKPLKEFLENQERSLFYLQSFRHRGPMWADRETMSRAFKDLFAEIGDLPPVKAIHGYRFTFSSHLLSDSSTNPVMVQKLLGHKRIETTMLYLNSDQLELKETVDKLG